MRRIFILGIILLLFSLSTSSASPRPAKSIENRDPKNVEEQSFTTAELNSFVEGNDYVILNTDMGREMQQYAIDTARSMVDNESLFDLADEAEFIASVFAKKYGHHWHCFIGRNFSSDVTYTNFIEIEKDEKVIFLYKMGREGCYDDFDRDSTQSPYQLQNGKAEIIFNKMNEEMTRDAVDAAIEAIEEHSSDANYIAKFVRKEFDEKHNLYWHCVVSPNKLGASYSHDTGKSIVFWLETVYIILFKKGTKDCY